MSDRAQSIQQAAQVAAASRTAATAWAEASQADVDRVSHAMAEAGYANAASLAQLACDETGYGRADHKTFKNVFCSRHYLEQIRHLPTIGVIRADAAEGVIEIAEPVGVIAGLVPVTNPTATTLFYGIAGVRARNAVVCAPHPRAVECIDATARIMEAAATSAGAPPGLVTSMTAVTLEGTRALMADAHTDLVLATGSRAMVLAAYSSGKPTYAVGPGNSPAYVTSSAPDLTDAASGILASKTFDYGTACASEQAVIADQAIASTLRADLERNGAYFVTPDEQARLEAMFFPTGDASVANVDAVGQSAVRIAAMAGIGVPADTQALVCQPAGVGPQAPLSHELLCPVLKWYEADTSDAGIATATALLRYGGEGHTAAIWSSDDALIARYARVPAYRICVNTPTLFGAMGYSTGFVPSFTLGTGTIGGAVSSDNINPQHLINRKRVGQVTRSWRDAFSAVDAAPRQATAAAESLPPAQAALMAHAPLPPARLTPPPVPVPAAAAAAANGAALPLGSAPIDIESLVREAIEEVIAS